MKQEAPRKAVVLAAGLSTRMRPLSYDLPKAMMPLWGKPMIEHVVGLLAGWRVREVLINLHHNPGPIFEHFRKRAPAGLKIEFSFEPEILGTGGVLRRADWLFGREPFWMINADVAADVSPAPFLREFAEADPLAVLWLHDTLGPRTVEVNGDDIACFHGKTPGAPGTRTFCGLHLVSPDILDYIPRAGFASIIDAYERAMADGKRVLGVTVPRCFWADVGTPRQYVDAHRAALDAHRARGRGSAMYDARAAILPAAVKRAGRGGVVAVGRHVAIGRNVSIKNSVLWDGACVADGARLSGAVVAENTAVRGVVAGPAIRCDMLPPDPGLGAILCRLRWEPGSATLAPMSERGSGRSFARISTRNKSAIFIRHDGKRRENTLYAPHTRFLRRRGIPAPAILADAPEHCCTALQDLGDCALREAISGLSPRAVEKLYRAVLGSVLKLHHVPRAGLRRGTLPLEPAFTPHLYFVERRLFARYFLGGAMGMDGPAIAGAMADLRRVARQLMRAPMVLIHRDLQSSNVMLHGGRAWLIDFQGMRLGPAAYDLASFLCDPYVMPPPDLQDRLLSWYVSRLERKDDITGFFWQAAVERLAQALGAYGRFDSLYGIREYRGCFRPALEMMRRALDHLDGLNRLKDVVATLLGRVRNG